MTKTLEIHYSQQADGFEKGRVYANPRFFSTPRNGATKVFIYGHWPNIEAAYQALGVPVERMDPAPIVAPIVPVPAFIAPKRDEGPVAIPAGWRDLKWSRPNAEGLTLRGLASSVSSTAITNSDQAVAAIEGELVSRAKAAGWVDGEPTAEQAEGWLSDVAEHRRRDEPQEALGGLSIREAHDKLTKAGVEWEAGATPEDLAELLAIVEA